MTLEVAKAHTPMVVAYCVSDISAFIFRRLRLTKLATLVNILLGKEIIPELLQEDCTPLMIATAASNLLSSPARMDAQMSAVDKAFAMLTPTNHQPSDIAADVVLSEINL